MAEQQGAAKPPSGRHRAPGPADIDGVPGRPADAPDGPGQGREAAPPEGDRHDTAPLRTRPGTGAPAQPDGGAPAGQQEPAKLRIGQQPVRPVMSDTTPPPIEPLSPEQPGPLKAARTLWILSFVAGLVAAAVAYLGREAQLESLQTRIADLDPGRGTDVVEAAASMVLYGSLGAIGLLILLELLFLRALVRRRGWARVALFVVTVVHAVVTVVVQEFLAAPGADGAAVRWLLIGQLLLACAAFVAACLPKVGAWLRS
ncbi:hypothetical protein [Georgenia sp. AZ-5]|uniref:hypothetical protein n=1 Tax=Georgenia sp. AZ-5 TaxID=3367526 RepID=UPI0037550A33